MTTMQAIEKTDHGRQNAEAHYQTIAQGMSLISRMIEDNDLAERYAARFNRTAEDIQEELRESALSVQVRSGWYEPGSSDTEPLEFEILLSTGGPALRIRGDLDEHCVPLRAYMEYQDWGTPWTLAYPGPLSGEVLREFANLFWFGE